MKKEDINKLVNNETTPFNLILEKDEEIERLNNIIKEVREYINENEDYYYNYPLVNRERLLEILDKVGSDKE